MVNYMRMLRLNLLSLLLCILSLQGCSSQSVFLVHPQSGSTVRCNATGAGLMAGVAEGFVEECVRSHAKEGYVTVDKLTPEQRADLEKRGVLPKPEPPTFQMDRM